MKLLVSTLIAVCLYRFVMISIDLSETAQIKHTGNPRQNSVRDKIQEFFYNNFFFDKIFFATNVFPTKKKIAFLKETFFFIRKRFCQKKKFSDIVSD